MSTIICVSHSVRVIRRLSSTCLWRGFLYLVLTVLARSDPSLHQQPGFYLVENQSHPQTVCWRIHLLLEEIQRELIGWCGDIIILKQIGNYIHPLTEALLYQYKSRHGSMVGKRWKLYPFAKLQHNIGQADSVYVFRCLFFSSFIWRWPELHGLRLLVDERITKTTCKT